MKAERTSMLERERALLSQLLDGANCAIESLTRALGLAGQRITELDEMVDAERMAILRVRRELEEQRLISASLLRRRRRKKPKIVRRRRALSAQKAKAKARR